MNLKKILIIASITFCLVFTIQPSIQPAEGDYTGTHWDTAGSGNADPHGITTDGNYIWVHDYTDDKVYKYNMVGTFQSSWSHNALNSDSLGIATDGTNIWLSDFVDKEVYKYDMSGNYDTKWATWGGTTPGGITTDGSNIWVADGLFGGSSVYKYQMDGTYVNSWDSGMDDLDGIATNGSFIWLVNATSNEVWKFNMAGVYQSKWSLDALNAEPWGITMNDCYFWVTDMDVGDMEVYLYSADSTPPTPNPSTWDTEPTASAPSYIGMVADTATDACGGTVYYFFNETTGNPGGSNSDWQISRVYGDSGLRNDTQYGYRVKTRDQYGNEGTYSSISYEYTYKYIYTLDPVTITTTFVTLAMQCYEVTGDVGFYWGNNTVSVASHEHNDTAHTNLVGFTGIKYFNINVNESTYYHAMAWFKADADGFYNGTEVYFIVPPSSPPSNFTVSAVGFQWMNLTWINEFFQYTSSNQSTVIKMSTIYHPTWTQPWDNTEIYNGTGTWYNVTPLDTGYAFGEDTTIYFSAWTYVNDTASPFLWDISDSSAHASDRTLSGLFNITIRWENSTYGKIPLDLATRSKHEHIFYVLYALAYEENYYEEGLDWYITDTREFTDVDITDGNWTISVTGYPREMKFIWEGYDTSWFFWDSGDYCTRTLVVEQFPDKDITFYLRTDLNYVPLILGGLVDWMNRTFLGEYTYTFIDNHGGFSLDDHPYAYIYTYDALGNKRIIHSEYFDRNMEIRPTLVFGKTYYLGVKSDIDEMPYIGKAPTGSDGHVTILIPKTLPFDYSIFDFIDVDAGRTDDLLYIDFTDTTVTTVNASIRIAVYLNGTIVYTESTVLDNYNFTFTFGDGYDSTIDYAWCFEITLQEEGFFSTGFIPLYVDVSYTITDVATLDAMFELMLGPTPLVTSAGVGVGYAYMCVAILAIIGLLAFRPEQAHIGLAVEGLIFMLSAGAIAGLENLFANYSWQQGVVLGAVGLFLFILGIWAAIAGKPDKEEKK